MPACLAATTSAAKQRLIMKKSKAGKNADAEKKEAPIATFLEFPMQMRRETKLVFQYCVCLYNETCYKNLLFIQNMRPVWLIRVFNFFDF